MRRLLLLVPVALALLAAGCGGGSDSSSTATTTAATSSTTSTSTGSAPLAPIGSDAEARAAAETVLAAQDAGDACGRFTTPHYLEQAYGGRAGCVAAQAPGANATSLASFRVTRTDEAHGRVTAAAVPAGGPYDGQRIRVELIWATTHFRVDALHANVPVGP